MPETGQQTLKRQLRLSWEAPPLYRTSIHIVRPSKFIRRDKIEMNTELLPNVGSDPRSLRTVRTQPDQASVAQARPLIGCPSPRALADSWSLWGFWRWRREIPRVLRSTNRDAGRRPPSKRVMPRHPASEAQPGERRAAECHLPKA